MSFWKKIEKQSQKQNHNKGTEMASSRARFRDNPLSKKLTQPQFFMRLLFISSFFKAQIQTLFQMLSFSYINTIKDLHAQVSHHECWDKLQVDLKSRGLCLVPVSVTESKNGRSDSSVFSLNNYLLLKFLIPQFWTAWCWKWTGTLLFIKHVCNKLAPTCLKDMDSNMYHAMDSIFRVIGLLHFSQECIYNWVN